MSKKTNGAKPNRMQPIDVRVSFATAEPKQRPAAISIPPVRKMQSGVLSRFFKRRKPPVDEGSKGNRPNVPALPQPDEPPAPKSRKGPAPAVVSSPFLSPTEPKRHQDQQFAKMNNDHKTSDSQVTAELTNVTPAIQVMPLTPPQEAALDSAAALPMRSEATDITPLDQEALPVAPADAVPAPVPDAKIEVEITESVIAAPTEESYQMFKQGGGKYFTATRFAIAGSDNHGYEDAADFDAEVGRVAIADGTTLGGHSEIVARELVRGFIHRVEAVPQERATSHDFSERGKRQEWWTAVRKAWYEAFDEQFNQASATEQVKWNRGGSSTFTGLQLREDGDTYRLFHVGDCSVLWFADGKHVHTDGATHHNAHPDVLHTEQDTPDSLNIEERSLPRADAALLCTDALAKHLLNETPWETDSDFLTSFEARNADEFRNWTSSLQDEGRLDSDDYTALVLRLHSPAGKES